MLKSVTPKHFTTEQLRSMRICFLFVCCFFLFFRQRATVTSGHPQHLGVIVLTVAQKGMK